MHIPPFDMERWQSTWEHLVDINLSESGVEPQTPRELLGDDPDACAALLDQQLVYTQTNGTVPLRERIMALYPGATTDHVEVTNGGAEANCVSVTCLLEGGDEVVAMLPNYMQIPGWVRALGAEVRGWNLVPDPEAGRWRPDLDALADLVTPRTRLICICTPNNPTGSIVTADELDAICTVADRAGAWVLSDEIYRGAERATGEEAPSVWGRSDRVVVTSGLSKAYGLPGLRVGWIVGPPDFIDRCWTCHDYTTIAPGALSDRLATVALAPERRAAILERTRRIVRDNYPVIAEWLAEHARDLEHIPPAAGAMLWLSYRQSVNSTVLCERLRVEHGTLVVPGDHYGMDGYLRIGFGGEPEKLREGLTRVQTALSSV